MKNLKRETTVLLIISIIVIGIILLITNKTTTLNNISDEEIRGIAKKYNIGFIDGVQKGRQKTIEQIAKHFKKNNELSISKELILIKKINIKQDENK